MRGPHQRVRRPDEPGPRGVLVSEPESGERSAWSPTLRPIPVRRRSPPRAPARQCTRCGRRSSRLDPAHGRPPGAIAANANARQVNPGWPPSERRRFQVHPEALIVRNWGCRCPTPCPVGQMLLIVVGEQRGAIRVHGHEVQPVARLGMLCSGQCLITGRADGCGGQTGLGVGVPRGLGVPVFVGGGQFWRSNG